MQSKGRPRDLNDVGIAFSETELTAALKVVNPRRAGS